MLSNQSHLTDSLRQELLPQDREDFASRGPERQQGSKDKSASRTC